MKPAHYLKTLTYILSCLRRHKSLHAAGKKTGMVTIQAVYIFFIPKKITEHPSPVKPAGIFKFEFLLLLKVNVNKNNILGSSPH